MRPPHPAAQRRERWRWPLSNVLAIAQKELKSYFASPIAYIVIGFFVLLFGFFYYTLLMIFNQQSMQMMGFEGAPVQNVNDQMIRPLFLNASVIVLFVLPMITMRTYSEEKRSGTIELLLTSPLTDFQIIMGKFLGAMALYGAMLAVTFVHMAILYAFGSPEWVPIATGYLGLLLMGGCFISAGLLISSLTKNQIVAGMITFAVFLLLWVINWVGSFTGPTTKAVLDYLSITNHLDDFTRGILDTKHLVYYLSFIAFGLFLTARSVDTERWRG
jgi:ABC-2 type transport system permease protein